METIYEGSIIGVNPSLSRLTNTRDLNECWIGRAAKLEINNETIILSFSWNGYQYKSGSCKFISPDYYQLSVVSSGGWSDKAFLRIYKNETGIIVKGDWVGTTDSEVWGEFKKVQK